MSPHDISFGCQVSDVGTSAPKLLFGLVVFGLLFGLVEMSPTPDRTLLYVGASRAVSSLRIITTTSPNNSPNTTSPNNSFGAEVPTSDT